MLNSAENKIGRSFAWMAWSGAVSVANSVVLWVYLARMRDVEELGRFTIVMGLYALFMTVCALGLPAYMVAEISRRRAANGNLSSFISNAAVVLFAAGLVSAAVMSLCGLWASAAYEVRLAAAILSLAVLPSGLIAVAESALVATGRTRLIAAVTTLENVLRTAVPIYLIWVGSSLVAIFLSLALIRSAALMMYAVAAGRRLRKFRIDIAEIRCILVAAPTFAAMVVLSSVIWQSAAVLLGHYSTEAETAEYGAASRFLIPVMILLSSYAGVVQPALARLAEEERSQVAGFLWRSLRIPLFLSIIAAAASPFLAAPVLTTLFGERYASSADVLVIFALCLAPFCLVMIVARGLYAFQRQRVDLIANAAGVVVFFAAALALIPSYGAAGAAAAQLGALILMAVIVVAAMSNILSSREKSRPRILMIGMHLTKTRGGITTLIAEILRSPVSTEFDITYIASQAEELNTPAKLVLAVTSAVRSAYHCIVRRPALVYVHIGANASLYREGLHVLLAKLCGRKVAAHFHAGDIDIYFPKQPRLGQCLIRAALDASDSIIAVSRESAAKIRAISGCENIVVIPNAINASRFHKRTSAAKDAVHVLFVGAVGRLKGEHDLLKALAQLKNANLNLKASIVGYNAEDLKPDIDALGIAHMIEHLGPVPTELVPEHYAAADVFVLPTYAEAMPMSVLEAMAAGLAIVTTDVGGIPEIVKDGETALLFGPGDVSALSANIRRLAADAQMRSRLGENARREVIANFDINAFGSSLRDHLKQAVTTAPSGGKTELLIKRTVKTAAAAARTKDPAPGIHVIAYHRVVGDLAGAERAGYYGLSVSADTFRKHCEVLAARYDIVSLEAAADRLAAGTIERPLAVITFDDGYLDFYENAYPVLSEMGLPATMFVPTNFMGGQMPLAHDRIFWLLKTANERNTSLAAPLKDAGLDPSLADQFARPQASLRMTEQLVYLPFRLREDIIGAMENALGFSGPYPDEYRLLDWAQIREMSSAGITFGAHTVNHVVLPVEDTETIVDEVAGSKDRLETELGLPVTTFAYPNGESNPDVRAALASAGFRVAVTTKPALGRPGVDLLGIGRTSLCEESTRGIFGVYSHQVAALRLTA